ncbi:MAG: sulfatase-like hydrolase/transferase [Acidobacteria bacterium]|nr:sulfatase-like hydrolase/transferase [Acidobacteriota bacterium]
MSYKIRLWLPILYLALFGSYCGLEIDTFVADTPFFRIETLLLFVDTLWIMLVPPILYAAFRSIRPLHANRAVEILLLILGALCFHFAAFLAIYKSVRKIDFDFYFFWYNTADALPTLWKLFAPWFPVVILSIAAFTLFQKPAFSPVVYGLGKMPRKTWLFLLIPFLFSAFCQLATIRNIRGSAAGFLYASFFSDRRLRNDYTELYRKHVAELRSNAPKPNGAMDPSKMGEVVFFIKQESLNGFLVNPNITPQLLRASLNGILFPKFYANSIQSLRGYECVLCGIAPSITLDMVDEYPSSVLKELNCLPRIFKALGYHPLYFFGGSRNVRIMRFAESIGFEEVLADDIVQPADAKFDWGYREDVYFRRIHEYLLKNYSGQKLFVFIDTGATNHTPFHVLDDALRDKVPFPDPKKFNEHLSNTTFVQDAYFGQFYDLFIKHYAHRGSLVVVSDHAWPIMRHKDNIYNERGAYEENFLIPFLFVPPYPQKDKFAAGATVHERFSQMDIYPTVLELLGTDHTRLLGESFAPWMLSSPTRQLLPPQKTKISVQPYGGGFISAVRYPEKFLFDVLGRNVKVYNLGIDPDEQSPEIHDVGEYMHLIRDFFHSDPGD